MALAFRIQHLDVTESTNAVVKRAIEAGEAEGLCVQAGRQTQGYGRRGHVWESPEGGLYVSLLLRPYVEDAQLATLPLVVGLAVREACEIAAPSGVFLVKWPNDVLLEGVKIAGISCEKHAGAVCLGIGVDAQDLPGAPAPDALRDALLIAFAARYEAWLADGFAPFAAEFALTDALAGRPITIEIAGRVRTCGIAHSVDEAGRLALRDATGALIRVSSGEAHILRSGGTAKGDSMLLAIDVGNTKTCVALFEGAELVEYRYFDTDLVATPEDALAQIAEHLGEPDLTSACISCVVAARTAAWCDALREGWGIETTICTGSAANALGLFAITFDNMDEIGPDLVADAIAAVAIHGAPVVIVDFGTATTIEFMTREGLFAGVSIAPGAESSMAALFAEASAIDAVPVAAPAHVLGTDTVMSVQSGIVFGEAARADGLVDMGLAELGYEEDVPVVATGGLAELVSAFSRRITHVDKFLTLKGLQIMDAAAKAAKAAAVSS